MNLRKYAEGKPCMVRLPGVCNGDERTTVLAHYRLIGISGMSMKVPDILGAWACFECHQAVDRRAHMDLEFDFVRLAHAEGCFRTIAKLIEDKEDMTKRKRTLRPWHRLLWGIQFRGSVLSERPMLLGDAWCKPMPQPGYPGEPTRALLFRFRREAREWCRNAHTSYAGRDDCCAKWRFSPVRVEETVRATRRSRK